MWQLSQLWQLCHVIQSGMLTVYHSPTHFPLLFTFPFQLYINWNSYLICNRAWLLCNFHFWCGYCYWNHIHPLIEPFIFRDLVCHYQLVDPDLCVGLILSCRTYRPLPWCYIEWLSTYLVRWLPCIWITALQKVYLCNQGGTVSPFLSRLSWQILSLTDKHGITLIPAYIPTHLSMEANYLSWGQMLREWHLLPQVAQATFHLWGLPEVDLLAFSCTTQCQHYYMWKLCYLLGPWGWMPSTILGCFS